MAPKRSLASRNKKNEAKLNLEEAAAERIDAVTAEPLHETKFVEIKSPDGNLRLFYNTSTLIRIATDRGMFMQPPHFREQMVSSLQKEVEKIEGRTFHFEKSNVFLSGSENIHSGMHVLHRHVYFDQIMDEFYLLNPAEVYVCPACYLHWVTTRYVTHMRDLRQRLEYLDNDADPVVDPLDVLAHMQGVEGSLSSDPIANLIEEVDDSSSGIAHVPLIIPRTNETENWDSPLVHIVFRRAAHWKQHVRQHHQDTHTSAVDYRLRDFLCQYFARFNRISDERSQRRVDRGEQVSGQPSLTLTRYWHINARFNRLRYNRIVESVERAMPYVSECVGRMAFSDENIMNTFQDTAGGTSDDDDFICDDSESDSGSGDAGHYRNEYSESSCSNDEESDAELEEEEEEEEEEDIRKGADDKGNREQVVGMQKHSRAKGESASALSLHSRVAPSSSSSSSSSFDENEVAERNAGTANDNTQQNIFKRGLLATLPDPYRRLSYDERRVIDSCSKRVFRPTALYTPQTANLEDSDEKSEEEIDWSQVGGTIEDTKDYVQDRRRQREKSTSTDCVMRKKLKSSVGGHGNLSKSALNVEENDSAKCTPPPRGSKLLLDDGLDIPQESTPTPSKRALLLMDEPDSS